MHGACKSKKKLVSNAWRFELQHAELPLRQSRSANRDRFLEVYVYYCFVLRNLSTIETCQKIDHTIGMKIGLELLTQDKRNRIWAPIEKKIDNIPPTRIEPKRPNLLECALPEYHWLRRLFWNRRGRIYTAITGYLLILSDFWLWNGPPESCARVNVSE